MFVYTALGDSITYGENATSPQKAYPSLIISMLGSHSIKAYGQILAEPGWTSEALKTALLTEDSLPIRQSTAVSIWIGGDDLAYAGLAVLRGVRPSIIKSTLASYQKNLATMVVFIRKVSKARIILCTQYNPFPNSPVATQGIDALNQITGEVASRLQTSLAPVHGWFAGRQPLLISGYHTGRIEDVRSGKLPIHPNNQGHLVIAQGLLPYVK